MLILVVTNITLVNVYGKLVAHCLECIFFFLVILVVKNMNLAQNLVKQQAYFHYWNFFFVWSFWSLFGDEHSNYVFLHSYFIVFSSVNHLKPPNLAMC